ncbi:NAD(P)/FAD-dependent oxidoreductase [Sedimenticola selenatireducens]|nr:FAD-dependent oxidoreductase [Sedimenticola selenatireducens]
MKIAVVGSGISGLASAWLLNQKHEVTLFEAANYLGGHTNTVDVTLEGVTHPVDTGFLVHNDLTYPNLIQLFKHLDVETYDTEMSFSVKLPDHNVEWAGSSLSTVFGQKRNLIRLAFLRMLIDLLRFNSRAQQHLLVSRQKGLALGELLDQEGYSSVLRDWYLLPMAAAIWSCSPEEILRFPAETFLNFCINHRLLQVEGRPQWRTIAGGGRAYVKRMAASIDTRLNHVIERVTRSEKGVELTSGGVAHQFDAVIFATHAPDTLRMLADADEQEKQVLGAVGYQANTAVLHTDARFLPERESLWSAWNYLSTGESDQTVCVTYLLNKLQRLPFNSPVMVTLNPPETMQPEHEIARYHYDHPVFDQVAIAAQSALPQIQGRNRAWFCGAWCGYGFHEDGLKSALRVTADFDVEAPWPVVL